MATVAVGAILLAAVLAGSGQATAIPPEIDLSPASLDFGVVNQGQTSAPQDVVITNTSGRPIGPVSIDGAVAPGEAQADVFLLDDRCTGLVLQPGDPCVLRYTFRPFFIRTSHADLDVQVQEQVGSDQVPVGAVFRVTLTGIGVNPLEVTPTVLDLGAVPVGTTSTSVTGLRVRNASDQPFGPLSLARSDDVWPPFEVDLDPCWGAVLAPGASCDLPVSFRPEESGPASVVAELGISATADRAAVSFPYELRGCGDTPAAPCSATTPTSSTSTSTTTAPIGTTTTSVADTTTTLAPPFDPAPSPSAPEEGAPAPGPAVSSGSGAASAGAALARTGSSDPRPLVATGALLLAAGAAAVVAARRRRLPA